MAGRCLHRDAGHPALRPESPGPDVPDHMKALFAGLPVNEWDPIWPHGGPG